MAGGQRVWRTKRSRAGSGALSASDRTGLSLLRAVSRICPGIVAQRPRRVRVQDAAASPFPGLWVAPCVNGRGEVGAERAFEPRAARERRPPLERLDQIAVQ